MTQLGLQSIQKYYPLNITKSSLGYHIFFMLEDEDIHGFYSGRELNLGPMKATAQRLVITNMRLFTIYDKSWEELAFKISRYRPPEERTKCSFCNHLARSDMKHINLVVLSSDRFISPQERVLKTTIKDWFIGITDSCVTRMLRVNYLSPFRDGGDFESNCIQSLKEETFLSRFSCNSEAFASELPENLEEIFSRYYYIVPNLQPHNSVLSVLKGRKTSQFQVMLY